MIGKFRVDENILLCMGHYSQGGSWTVPFHQRYVVIIIVVVYCKDSPVEYTFTLNTHHQVCHHQQLLVQSIGAIIRRKLSQQTLVITVCAKEGQQHHLSLFSSLHGARKVISRAITHREQQFYYSASHLRQKFSVAIARLAATAADKYRRTMKFRSNCCCWLTLLLVGSSVISVSPNSSTTATTIFQQQTHRQPSVHPTHIRVTQSSKEVLSKTITNKLKSLQNYLFASTTMSFESASTTQRSPVTSMSVQQQLLTSPSSSSPPTSRTTTTKTATTTSSSSSSSLSSSSAVSTETSSLDVNSIKRWKRSHSIDGTAAAANISSVTGAMVHHHFSEQKMVTESYPSMFFQMNTKPRRQTTLNRIQRDVEMNDDGGMDKCHKFVEGEPDQNIMYSPDYPNNYPKNINCTRIIEAPRGQLIRLDFRNSFSIEQKEECKFDYLEIRDGPYGFSNFIGRFCGEEFPPMITSRERHLWLHFHSDESIEYSGFTAVYEFIDRPKEAISTELNCTIETTDLYEGYINSTDVPQYVLSNVTIYKIPLDCMWIVKVKENWKISLKFIHFNLIRPNDCDTNFIDIFGEDTNIPSRVKNFCGSTGEAVSSESNILHIRFFAEQVAMNSSFKMLYTAFRGPATSCQDDEFDCQDATCIWGKLRCNKRDNCKFRWDEEGCEEEEGKQSEHVTIIIVVFGLILGGMIATFLVNCVRKIMRDQKIIREHIRQSRESKLDEMGRLSKARSKDNVSGVLSPRQKHSQTSLQILDDVSQRYYREVVPISVQTGKTDLKDHSILRNHHDMVVQTSLCADSSTPERGITGSGDSGGVCDMGCQTRESLFQPLARQKSIESSSPNQSTAAAIRFSTFGYDMPPPPPLGCGQKSGTLSRQSSTNIRQPSGSIELEERLRTASHHSQQHHSHSHLHGGGGGGSAGSGDPSHAPTMRPPQEMCHHHHQHQQHLQKHQMQQLQQQQQQQPSTVGTMGSHQHSHHQAPPGGGKLASGKHHKHDETSKVFIDIRNSAPDVIIMTSH